MIELKLFLHILLFSQGHDNVFEDLTFFHAFLLLQENSSLLVQDHDLQQCADLLAF